jgi:hypothetical protein
MKRAFILTLICAPLAFTPALAQAAAIVGGITSAKLDPLALNTAGLTISSLSPEVIVPGNLVNSIAFPINTPSAAIRPTTFMFDPATFPAPGSFSGEINHEGSVFFNSNTLEVGDFTIAFNAARVGTLGGQASGFYVKSNAGIMGILFDVTPPTIEITPTGFKALGDLLISPEFAQKIVNLGLANTNPLGLLVGRVRPEGTVPEPTAVALALSAVAMAGVARRRR